MLFCKLHADFHVSFTEERLPSGHSAIKPRSVECCSDGCPSGSFSHLHTGSLELSQSDHRVLGHLSYQGPCPLPIAQFGQAASSRKSPGCSKLLPFKNYGGHCALGNLQCSRIFFSLPRSVPQHNPVSELCRQFLQLMAWFLLWYALSAVRPYIDRCVPFQIMSNQLNLPQVDSNQGVETSQRWSREMGGTWANVIAVLMSMWYFSFYFLINLVCFFVLYTVHSDFTKKNEKKWFKKRRNW